MFGNNSVPKGGFNAFKAPARQPAGQAQSQQQPSAGTKYGAYTPPTSQSTGDPRGAYATASPNQRPPPMQIAPAQTAWGQSMDPFAERDAFVRQIGQQRINNQIAFNTSGPNAPQGSPFINYGMAAQNAGLSGGAPSMNANPADTFIGRFNNQYGAPVNPGFGGGQSQQAYYPGGPGGFPVQPPPQPQSPGRAQPIGQDSQGTPYRQPPSQPQYGTPPDRRGEGRTADWRDADKDGVDDRDQDGPGMPAYRSGQSQPIRRPPTPVGYNPTSTVGPPPMPPSGPANPYGPPVIDRPAPPAPRAKDAKRAEFLDNKASGLYGGPAAATYDDYVKRGLDDVAGMGIADERQFFAMAAQRGVAPSDDWLARKTGKSGAEGRTQYFNDAMARQQSKRPQAIAKPGNAQSIPPREAGMPPDYGFNLPPGTTPADIRQSYNARMAARENAPPPWMQPATQVFAERPWQTRR